MSYKEARRGAAIAGAVLFAMPVIEVYYGFGTPGPVHFVMGSAPGSASASRRSSSARDCPTGRSCMRWSSG